MEKALALFILFVIFCMSSCGEYELLEHQKECKRRADSLFKSEIKQLSQANDSICDLNYDKYYQASLDSLIPARKNEIKNLISK